MNTGTWAIIIASIALALGIYNFVKNLSSRNKINETSKYAHRSDPYGTR